MVQMNSFKLARMSAGLSQKELAEKIGVSESLIAKYETGRARPNKFRLERIAQILNVTPEQLEGKVVILGRAAGGIG